MVGSLAIGQDNPGPMSSVHFNALYGEVQTSSPSILLCRAGAEVREASSMGRSATLGRPARSHWAQCTSMLCMGR